MNIVVFQVEGAGIKFPENKAAGVSLRSSRVRPSSSSILDFNYLQLTIRNKTASLFSGESWNDVNYIVDFIHRTYIHFSLKCQIQLAQRSRKLLKCYWMNLELVCIV